MMWNVEEYYGDLKQFCGVERIHVKSGRGQIRQISLVLRFIRPEWRRLIIEGAEARRKGYNQGISTYLA